MIHWLWEWEWNIWSRTTHFLNCFTVNLAVLYSFANRRGCDSNPPLWAAQCEQRRSTEVNVCKLCSRWCGCTSGPSGLSPCWSQTTGSCLRQRSRTCSWTSSRCHVMQLYANSMTSSNEPDSPRSVCRVWLPDWFKKTYILFECICQKTYCWPSCSFTQYMWYWITEPSSTQVTYALLSRELRQNNPKCIMQRSERMQ